MNPLSLWKRRAAQQAARKEVLAQIWESPITAYGLYCLLGDAGLLSPEAQEELAPVMARIEARLSLDDDALVIALPMAFEPLTDVEHDTLTAVIAQALRTFAASVPDLEDPARLAGLLGVNALLERHAPDTAAITLEIDLDEVLDPLLKCCTARVAHGSRHRDGARPGDYFQASRPGRTKKRFAWRFQDERDLAEGEVVCIEEVGRKGYLYVQRLARTARYSRAWRFPLRKRIAPGRHAYTAVHADEGEVYRPEDRYHSAVAQFIALYKVHMEDRSPDPTTYRPTGRRGE